MWPLAIRLPSRISNALSYQCLRQFQPQLVFAHPPFRGTWLPFQLSTTVDTAVLRANRNSTLNPRPRHTLSIPWRGSNPVVVTRLLARASGGTIPAISAPRSTSSAHACRRLGIQRQLQGSDDSPTHRFPDLNGPTNTLLVAARVNHSYYRLSKKLRIKTRNAPTWGLSTRHIVGSCHYSRIS